MRRPFREGQLGLSQREMGEPTCMCKAYHSMSRANASKIEGVVITITPHFHGLGRVLS